MASILYSTLHTTKIYRFFDGVAPNGFRRFSSQQKAHYFLEMRYWKCEHILISAWCSCEPQMYFTWEFYILINICAKQRWKIDMYVMVCTRTSGGPIKQKGAVATKVRLFIKFGISRIFLNPPLIHTQSAYTSPNCVTVYTQVNLPSHSPSTVWIYPSLAQASPTILLTHYLNLWEIYLDHVKRNGN